MVIDLASSSTIIDTAAKSGYNTTTNTTATITTTNHKLKSAIEPIDIEILSLDNLNSNVHRTITKATTIESSKAMKLDSMPTSPQSNGNRATAGVSRITATKTNAPPLPPPPQSLLSEAATVVSSTYPNHTSSSSVPSSPHHHKSLLEQLRRRFTFGSSRSSVASPVDNLQLTKSLRLLRNGLPPQQQQYATWSKSTIRNGDSYQCRHDQPKLATTTNWNKRNGGGSDVLALTNGHSNGNNNNSQATTTKKNKNIHSNGNITSTNAVACNPIAAKER